MAFEETQKGNPHQITKKQHCFPASCIKRFCGSDGNVQVMLLPQLRERSAKPNSKVFCAARAWDERAEHGFMIKIEDEYRKLAEEVLSNTSINLDAKQQTIVTDMFALWNVRMHWKKQPVDDQLVGDAISVCVDLTKDEQEKLEKNGITAIRPDLTMPGRSLTGIGIQMNVINVRKDMKDAQWGILKCNSGEFIVPDHSPQSRMLPLAPSLCFFSQSENAEIDASELAKINACSIADSEEYYFARNFAECPR